jgi:CSLREA domain-containing protein
MYKLYAFALVVLLHLVVPAALHATTIIVSTTADDTFANRNCTLREAVIAANTDAAVDRCPAGSSTDTIILGPGTYTLSLTGPAEDLARTGDLDVWAEIILRGAGRGATVIDGGSRDESQLGDRVVHVSWWGSLTLQGLTVRGGFCAAGGGILNEGGLYLLDSGVQDNVASAGAASCTGVSYGVIGGAGIFNTSTGWIVASRLNVSGNRVLGEGGSFSAVEHPGGGLMNVGVAIIDHSRFADNGAATGGALWNGGGLEIADSEITVNVARFHSAALMNYEDAYVSRTTISNNQGGAIVNGSGYGPALLWLMSSTVSGNSSHGDPGSIVNHIGAVHIAGSTIANNSAAYPGAGISGFGYTDLVNTIVAGNGHGDCAAALVSLGNNLDSDGSCGLASAGDLSDVDPLLGPLADNGGPAPTHALGAGSPAIDHIPTFQQCTPSDQRGIARPFPRTGSCDIGAYEFSIAGEVLLILAEVKSLYRAGAITSAQESMLVELLKPARAAANGAVGADVCTALGLFAASVSALVADGSLAAEPAQVLLEDAARVQRMTCGPAQASIPR